MITGHTTMCMVIGDPVTHSLSPLLHNAAYAALGISDQFVFVACQVAPANIAACVAGIRAMHVRGVSCTMPHKELVMPLLDAIDPVAQKIGAVNTIVREGAKLVGYNTDWIGATEPLAARTTLSGKKVAVLGAGGAAKAFVYGLTMAGAQVTVYNRTLAKATALADQFNAKAAPLSDTAGIQAADIICNTTSVGMAPHDNESPIPASCMRPNHLVFDAVYVPHATKLLRDATACGAQTIHGVDMLLHQAMAQFTLYTGHAAPKAAMRKALQAELRARGDSNA